MRYRYSSLLNFTLWDKNLYSPVAPIYLNLVVVLKVFACYIHSCIVQYNWCTIVLLLVIYMLEKSWFLFCHIYSTLTSMDCWLTGLRYNLATPDGPEVHFLLFKLENRDLWRSSMQQKLAKSYDSIVQNNAGFCNRMRKKSCESVRLETGL